MDPVLLVVSALDAGNSRRPPDAPGPAAGGCASGGSRPATVQAAYARLWSRVRRALAGRPAGAMMLSRHADAPLTWAAPLTAELRAARAGEDPELVAAAADVLRMMNQNGFHGAGHNPAGHCPAGQGSPAVQA